jgi:hypothetical protein
MVLVDNVLDRRDVSTTEYLVRFAGKTPGQPMWLPAPQLHTQLVADFERTRTAEAAGTPRTGGDRLPAMFRELLAFMEPPAWAMTSQTISALSDSQLADFPLVGAVFFI